MLTPNTRIDGPSAIILDDDPSTLFALGHLLAKFGIQTFDYRSARHFDRDVTSINPDIFFIDLSIDAYCDGISIIRKLKNDFKSRGEHVKPIFVISSTSEPNKIEWALNEGATDYLIKPLERKVVLSKLSTHIETDLLLEQDRTALPQHIGHPKLNITADVEIISIDDKGIIFTSIHAPLKGSVIPMEGKLFEEITRSKDPVLMTVETIQYNKRTRLYTVHASFILENETVHEQARVWVQKHSND